jgi:ParB/RepB/Spo0J family partition protein
MYKKKIKAIEVAMDRIILPRYLVRTTNMDVYENVKELAKSIKEIGLIEPIVVRPLGENFELIVGWRRYHAHIQLGRESILAHVNHCSEAEALLMRWVENDSREDVHIIDQAVHLKQMLDALEISQEELSQKVGRSTAYISQRLSLLDTYPCIVDALTREEITFSQARELMQFKTEKNAMFYLHHAIQGGAKPSLIKQWRVEAEAFVDEEIERGTPEYNPEPVVVDLAKFICEGCRQSFDYRTISLLKVCPECLKLIQQGGSNE